MPKTLGPTAGSAQGNDKIPIDEMPKKFCSEEHQEKVETVYTLNSKQNKI